MTVRVDVCYMAITEHGRIPHAISFDFSEQEIRSWGIDLPQGELSADEFRNLLPILKKKKIHFDGVAETFVAYVV